MSDPKIVDEPHYLTFLESIRDRIQDTLIRVVKAASRELIGLYWSLGQLIVEKQEAFGWGKSVVERLADDLRSGGKARRGFSAQNLWCMRQFYVAYRHDSVLQQLVGEIPWGQNLAILYKVKSREARNLQADLIKLAVLPNHPIECQTLSLRRKNSYCSYVEICQAETRSCL